VKLKSIEEYNKERMTFFSNNIEANTGIACPQCGDQLKESNPGMLLMSNPPRKSVRCDTCNYSSSILA